jgi:hypothetical protein
MMMMIVVVMALMHKVVAYFNTVKSSDNPEDLCDPALGHNFRLGDFPGRTFNCPGQIRWSGLHMSERNSEPCQATFVIWDATTIQNSNCLSTISVSQKNSNSQHLRNLY